MYNDSSGQETKGAPYFYINKMNIFKQNKTFNKSNLLALKKQFFLIGSQLPFFFIFTYSFWSDT
jgi:hypothetical protein